MNHEFWYLSRAAGFTAYLLLFASVAIGMMSNMRLAGRTVPRVITFEAHRVVSLLALAFTFVHVYVLLGDGYFNFSIAELSLPFLSPYRDWQVAVGVFGLWTLVLITASFYVRQWIGMRTWRAIHYLAFALYGLATLHGVAAGTDTRSPWAASIYLLTGLVVLTLIFYRVQLVQPERRLARAARLAPAVAAVFLAGVAFAGAMTGNTGVDSSVRTATTISSPVDASLGFDDASQYTDDEDARYVDDDRYEDRDDDGEWGDHDDDDHEEDDDHDDDDHEWGEDDDD